MTNGPSIPCDWDGKSYCCADPGDCPNPATHEQFVGLSAHGYEIVEAVCCMHAARPSEGPAS